MKVELRKFDEKDIPLKVKWINDPMNNKYLHYNLPLREDKTQVWFNENKDRTDRYDVTIEVNDVPVGIIGLREVNKTEGEAEYYIAMGDRDFLGKGVAFKASQLLLDHAFEEMELNKVFLYAEHKNIPAQKLFEKTGFKKEGLVTDRLFYRGKDVTCYKYGLSRDAYLAEKCNGF